MRYPILWEFTGYGVFVLLCSSSVQFMCKEYNSTMQHCTLRCAIQERRQTGCWAMRSWSQSRCRWHRLRLGSSPLGTCQQMQLQGGHKTLYDSVSCSPHRMLFLQRCRSTAASPCRQSSHLGPGPLTNVCVFFRVTSESAQRQQGADWGGSSVENDLPPLSGVPLLSAKRLVEVAGCVFQLSPDCQATLLDSCCTLWVW